MSIQPSTRATKSSTLGIQKHKTKTVNSLPITCNDIRKDESITRTHPTPSSSL
ncbi:hypothetical protein BT69DRAFT_1278020, partial [Atractiella rhizophila]